jgi:hypothetical protein
MKMKRKDFQRGILPLSGDWYSICMEKVELSTKVSSPPLFCLFIVPLIFIKFTCRIPRIFFICFSPSFLFYSEEIFFFFFFFFFFPFSSSSSVFVTAQEDDDCPIPTDTPETLLLTSGSHSFRGCTFGPLSSDMDEGGDLLWGWGFAVCLPLCVHPGCLHGGVGLTWGNLLLFISAVLLCRVQHHRVRRE